MEKQITCINCPVGCRLTVTLENGQVTEVSGHGCKRGETYAHQECVAPTRMVTAAIPLTNRKTPVSVKTKEPIPKEKIFDCMNALSTLTLEAPIHLGDVVLADVCGTGVDVIATKSVE